MLDLSNTVVAAPLLAGLVALGCARGTYEQQVELGSDLDAAEGDRGPVGSEPPTANEGTASPPNAGDSTDAPTSVDAPTPSPAPGSPGQQAPEPSMPGPQPRPEVTDAGQVAEDPSAPSSAGACDGSDACPADGVCEGGRCQLSDCEWEAHDGHEYLFCGGNDREARWASARALCQSLGMDLAVVDNEAEHEFIMDQGRDSPWVGLTDAHQEGTWRWIVPGADAPGDVPGFDGWSGSQPNGDADENCAYLRSGWLDSDCDSERDLVCESY